MILVLFREWNRRWGERKWQAGGLLPGPNALEEGFGGLPDHSRQGALQGPRPGLVDAQHHELAGAVDCAAGVGFEEHDLVSARAPHPLAALCAFDEHFQLLAEVRGV